MNPSWQTTAGKLAEINYRKKLIEGDYKNLEPMGKELVRELNKRLSSAHQDFSRLKKRKVKLSPFLEIGAERGQRAMLLSSIFKENGFMLDISLQSLKTANQLKKPLNLTSIPRPVCADAHSLPFPDNSLAFIFTYQTLHHFSDPLPIIKEIYRVLAPRGVLFLNEEPVRQLLNLRLWRRPTKLRPWEKILKAVFILHFVSEIGKSETEAGITETSFPLKTWERILSTFEEIEATLTAFPYGPSQTLKTAQKLKSHKSLPNTNWLRPHTSTRFLLNLLGGNIRAICKKINSQRTNAPNFACPVCTDHPKLTLSNNDYQCPKCGHHYPIVDSIPILIEESLRKKLYGQ
jgi:ubiquinone/menaquinone biosynthesis C-methylase UbiE/uncharacterized protein YbaR (Trm112 family)